MTPSWELENWPTSEPKKTGLFCFNICMTTDFMVDKVVFTYPTPRPSETTNQLCPGSNVGRMGRDTVFEAIYCVEFIILISRIVD